MACSICLITIKPLLRKKFCQCLSHTIQNSGIPLPTTQLPLYPAFLLQTFAPHHGWHPHLADIIPHRLETIHSLLTAPPPLPSYSKASLWVWCLDLPFSFSTSSPLVRLSSTTVCFFHCYVHDIQPYKSTKSINPQAHSTLLNCLSSISLWMQNNFCKLNSAKLDILIIGPNSLTLTAEDFLLSSDNLTLSPLPYCCNLGVPMTKHWTLGGRALSVATHSTSTTPSRPN